MKTTRYNIYKRIHKEFRTQLLEAGIKIQTTDFSKPEKTRETLAILKETIRIFDDHLVEDAFIFDSIALAAPFIVSMFEKANEKNRQLSVLIAEKTKQYELLHTPAKRISFSADLQAIFFEFTASVLNNMNKEETVINELLWSSYTDNELTEMEETVNRLALATPAFKIVEEIRISSTSGHHSSIELMILPANY